MTFTLFIALLTIFAPVTSLVTEATKKPLDEHGVKYSSNVLACVISAVIGSFGSIVYYVLFNIPFTMQNIICIVLMGICTSVGAMVGYDKVMQTIDQIKNTKI